MPQVFLPLVLLSSLVSLITFFYSYSLYWFIFALCFFPIVGAFVISHVLLYPPWHKPSHYSDGLSKDIQGKAKEWYGNKTTNPFFDLGIEFSELEIPGVEKNSRHDGHSFILRAWFVKPRIMDGQTAAKTCIVCTHGAGRDRRAFLRHIPIFYEANYAVILFDCRDHGISDGMDPGVLGFGANGNNHRRHGSVEVEEKKENFRSAQKRKRGRGIGYAAREAWDVAIVTQYARKILNYEYIVAIGTSQGASSSIIAAAVLDRSINGVIAENPFSSRELLMSSILRVSLGEPPIVLQPLFTYYIQFIIWIVKLRIGIKGKQIHPNPIDIVPDLDCPLLLMHGTNDIIIHSSHSHQLFEKAKEPKMLWIVPGGEHTGLQNLMPNEWKEHVLTFIQQHVLPSSPSPPKL